MDAGAHEDGCGYEGFVEGSDGGENAACGMRRGNARGTRAALRLVELHIAVAACRGVLSWVSMSRVHTHFRILRRLLAK